MKLIITFIIIALGLFLSYGNDTQKKRLFFVVFCALLVVIQITFRDIDYGMNVSNDTIRYFYKFEDLKSTPFIDLLSNLFNKIESYKDRDPGFGIMVKTFQLVSKDFTTFLFFTASIVLIPLSRIIYRYSTSIISIVLSYVIFEFFFEGFLETGIRQTIALGFVLCGYPFLLGNKKWYYITLILIASTIHSTALIALPFLASKYIKEPKSILIISILFTPLLMTFSGTIASKFGGGSIFEKYLINSEDNAGTPVYSSFVIICSIAFLYVYKRFIIEAKDYKILTTTIVASLILMPFSWVDSNLLRLSFYYSFFYVVTIPIIIKLISIKIKVSYNTMCFCAILFLVFMMSQH